MSAFAGVRRAIFGPLRRLYDWVLSWAESPWGPAALFLLSVVESSFFPIPPDPLLIALCLGARRKSLWFALNCTIASVLGGLFGYFLGAYAFELAALPILELYGKVEDFDALAETFRRNGALAVFVPALTPVPYKLVTITSGAVSLDLGVFTLASILGRGLRFFAVAALLWWLGEPVARVIERWFEWITVGFAVALIGGFVVFRLLF
jgi:membrane protein YqaA with SNARE-associated domain